MFSLRIYAAALAAGAALPSLAHAQSDTPLIVVTASPLGKSSSELATPVTIIGRAELVRQGAGTLGDVLGEEPGITQSSFAAGASRPIIRGLDNARVRVQENGIGAHDASSVSEDHGIPIDPLAAQRVEVIRGPAVLRYGSEAIGGVVSVLNNRIPEAPSERALALEALTSYTSVDDGRDVSALIDAGGARAAGHVDGFWRRTEDDDIPLAPGTQERTWSEAKGGAAGGSIFFDRGFAGASLAHFDAEYGIPASEEQVFIDLNQDKGALAAGVSDFGPFASLRLNAGITRYTHDEVELPTGEIGATFDNDQEEARAELVHKPLGKLEGAFGAQYGNRDLEALGAGADLVAPSNTRTTAAFLFEELALSKRLSLQLGARIESARIKGTAFSVSDFNGSLPGTTASEISAALDFTPASASLGAVLKLPAETSLGATIAYVERAPDVMELFSKGPHEATETFELGDPGLDTERALALDVTLKRESGAFDFELAGFYTEFDGFIFKRFTGLVCGEAFDTCGIEGDPGVEDEFRQIVHAQSGATFRGLEASASWDAVSLGAGTLGLDGRFDTVRAELDGGGNVPRIPPLRVGGGVYYESPSLYLRAGVLRTERQDDVAAGETPTKGFTDVRADAVYTLSLPSADRQIDFGIGASNLLDEDERNHVSFKKADVVMPGRSVRLFVRARL